MPPASQLVLVAVVALAFTIEASLGFGATVITVALGALILPIQALLPAFVPLNVVLSIYLVARYRASIDRRLLLGRVVPLMALGLPLGILAFTRLPESQLKRAFAVFVIVLAVLELVRRAKGTEPGTLPRGVGELLLVLGGAVHGAFATGGPMAVYVAGRSIPDKAVFRATLAGLWTILNGVLLVTYALQGRLNGSSARLSGALAGGLVVGVIAGELVHARVPEARFRVAVYALLLGAGTVLLARA